MHSTARFLLGPIANKVSRRVACDLLIVETIFDTLNAKAALFAIDSVRSPLCMCVCVRVRWLLHSTGVA